MIAEDYVSFETAKILKEKGFDWDCQSKRFYPEPEYDQESPNGVSAPTLQTVMKWLREVHKLFIELCLHMNGSYVWYIYRVDCTPKGSDRVPHNYSYEEAAEAAIKYCLKNLI